MCWVRQHHVATSRHVQMLDANNLQGSLLRKGCQNCQNPKLLGQSLIQEQWHRKPQPICGCVWGLGCSTNKGAIAHTRHITTHISNDSAELHSYQMQHSGWRGFALQRHVAATQSILHIGQTWPNEKKTQMVRCLAIAMSLKIWKTERPFMSRNKHSHSFRRDTRMGNATVWLTTMQSFVDNFGAICFWDYAQQSAMCWVRQHHVATSRRVQILDANNLQGSLLRKGCQNCQNPKLLGQSLIQEQWHRKPQPICGCVWGLGCSTNKGAVAHTTNHISTTPLAQDSARTAQPSAATFGLKWACMAGTCGCIGCNPKPCL